VMLSAVDSLSLPGEGRRFYRIRRNRRVRVSIHAPA